MIFETRNGLSTAKILAGIDSKQPIIVILTDKKTGEQTVETYNLDLTYTSDGAGCSLDLVEVKREE